jgi:signal transduction histidine kinase
MIVASTIDELQAVYPERKIVLSQYGHLDGHWDPDRISQALGHLIAKALLGSDDDATIALCVSDRGDDVHVFIQNFVGAWPEGPSLAGEAVADMTLARAGGAVVLGVLIAHEIIRAHGGSLREVAVPDRGSRFRVVLPRR